MAKTAARSAKIKLPPAHDWRTTDTDEINKRRQRAREESFVITNATPAHPIFSNFRVKSASGLTYAVEVRDLARRQFACDCVDFRINGLGVCKHVEAVLLQFEARHKRLFHAAHAAGSDRIEVIVDRAADALRVLARSTVEWPRALGKWFDGRRTAGGRAAGNRAGGLAPASRRRVSRKSASRRKSSPGSSSAAAPPSAGSCAANTNSRCKAANGPRRKRPFRSFPTSGKACCIWPSPNARCWPTKWAWAKPSRPSPPARCCTGSARRAACWSSRRPRSRRNGRIKSRNSPR